MTRPGIASIVALAAAVLAGGCGSSSSTSTAPAPVARCGVSIGTTDLNVPAGGGTGALAISTARECAWTASSNAAWLTFRGTSSGQGEGSVEYVASANAEPTTRRGAIALNDQLANVTQAAAECVMQLRESSASFAPAGGSGTIDVRASGTLCTWTAASDASWITIRSGASGTGNGAVAYDVGVATGAPRTGTVLVAGMRFGVTQSQGCTYTVTPSSAALGANGGSTTLAVTAPAGCPWTAASNVPWATVTQGATGTGSGVVQIDAAATSGPSRSGSVLVAGQSVALTQSGGCSFAVEPLAHSVAAQGGSASSTIQAASGCTWTASSDDAWITLTGPTTGIGNGTMAFAVAPVSGPARTGTITVAGREIIVNQSAGCTFAIAPQSQQVDPAGGEVSVSVTAAAGCAWTTSSGVSWITVAAGAAGSGDGTVRLVVAATSGGPRSGTVTIAGQTLTVTQGSGCAYGISPASTNVPASGGSGSVAVTTAADCGWTATSNASWLTISAGASGTGSGTVQYTAASTAGGPRSGTLTVAGQTFTVTQGSGCAFSIAPASASVPASGGNGSVAVTTAADCAWTATSNAAWLTVSSGASGTGNGTVQYSAASTTGGARTGTLTVAGQTLTVTQGSGCAFSIAPTSASVPASGGNGSVAVTTAADCAWTATSNAAWLTVSSGASGSGNGTVQYAAASTTGGARTGTLTIAGQTFTLTQGSGCAFSIAPTSASVPASGGNGSVAVTTATGCAWTATSNAPWLTVSAGASGSGNGTVQYAAASTTGGARSGTLTIAGQTFTVNQAAGCTIAIAPASTTVAAGASGPVSVSVTTAAGCAWTAVSGAPWITVTSGASGSGNGTVQITIAANTGAARSGSVAIGGHTFTVNQAGGCTFSVSPLTIPAGANGGGASIAVTAATGCAWSASSSVSWVIVSSGATGSGNGSVSLVIGFNSGSARSGTVTVAGTTVTVNQAVTSCTYTLSPTNRNAPVAGGANTFGVTTGPACSWTPTSTVSWITVTSGGNVTGNGTVSYTVQPNTGAARSGTITLGTQTFTVNQARP